MSSIRRTCAQLLMKMLREDQSAFSCHKCLEAIPKNSPLFFMHDRIFCSSWCRLSAQVGVPLAEHTGLEDARKCGVHKRTMSRISASVASVVSVASVASVVECGQTVHEGSFFAHLGKIGSWLSSDAFE